MWLDEGKELRREWHKAQKEAPQCLPSINLRLRDWAETHLDALIAAAEIQEIFKRHFAEHQGELPLSAYWDEWEPAAMRYDAACTSYEKPAAD